MSNLVFQVHIKQWDKAQRSFEHIAVRARIPDRHRITAAPKYLVLSKSCTVDQHGDDVPTNRYPKGRLKTALLSDGSIVLDRFHIADDNGRTLLSYREKNKPALLLGCLSDGWIQAKYHWRYSVEQAGQLYWLYEEFTFNAACVDELEVDFCLKSEPQTIFVAPEE